MGRRPCSPDISRPATTGCSPTAESKRWRSPSRTPARGCWEKPSSKAAGTCSTAWPARRSRQSVQERASPYHQIAFPSLHRSPEAWMDRSPAASCWTNWSTSWAVCTSSTSWGSSGSSRWTAPPPKLCPPSTRTTWLWWEARRSRFPRRSASTRVRGFHLPV